ncbi:hypothetical protein CASFOL_004810 [Castilleja foliolosa]|uniref:non-specific serine/threonine protein kinase n=1 Tax=Castilleja foliolosa TaxID=1961234 RepID=A0ABD3EBJ0_9LAMI
MSSSSDSPPPPSSSSSNSTESSPPPPTSSPPPPPPPSDDSSSSPPPPPQSSPPPPSDKSSPPPPPPPSNKNDHDDDKDHNKSPPPPPPPPRQPPTSHERNTPSSHSGSLAPPERDSSNDQKAVIAGAAAGVGLLFLIMIIFLVSCGRRKKRKHHDHMNYYRDNSHGHTGNDYYADGNSGGPWNNNSMGMVNVQIPPGSANVSSEHNWMVPPPPPPPMMSSSEMSSCGYSGPHHAPLPPPHPAVALGFNQSSFTYNDLVVATNGFAQSNLLGQGGFGYVHKGVLPNGKDIAVKSLKLNSGQGEREFQAEVDIISRVHHRHLVSLVGYCSAGTQRMLVYEYVPNGTLEYHLHGAGRPTMEWSTRLRIALGSAKGFAYLHEDCHPRIIHRDIKAANILIDFNFEAKVADFGLAKLSSDTNTHVSTRIMGTFGYLAPEYASSGKLTEKSDVYSYGIMLLELITGRRPVDVNSDDDYDTLVDWARPILTKVTEGGSYEDMVDPRLGDNYDPQEMLRMVHSAAACIRHSARRRPKMSQIVRALEGDVSLDDLNEGMKSGQNALLGSSGSSDYDLNRYNKKPGTPLSQDFNSSEIGLTGEFVHSSPGNSQEIHRPGPGYRTHSP